MKFCVTIICATALLITLITQATPLIEHKIKADELQSMVEVLKMMPSLPKPQDSIKI